MNDPDTDFIKQKNPVLYAVLSFIMKRIELTLIGAVLAGCNYLATMHEKHDVKWIEQHLQDKQQEIQQLEHK